MVSRLEASVDTPHGPLEAAAGLYGRSFAQSSWGRCGPLAGPFALVRDL